MNLSVILKKPVSWLGIVLLLFSFYHLSRENGVKSVIDYDGSGYYAYLPAVFLYNDPTFEKTAQIERSIQGSQTYQHYLIHDENGNPYNKYFPGIAVLQAPFFGLACFASWVLNKPIDGYSSIFIYSFFIGSLFYVFLSLYFLHKILKILFPTFEKQRFLVIIGLLFSSTLVFYMFHTPSHSHLYSFALFSAFYYLVLRLKDQFSKQKVFILAFVLALICIVRPTNVIIVLSIPFLLGNKEQTLVFFKNVFSNRGILFIKSSILFFVVLSVVFISWKWQTNTWVKGSYAGEGFYFTKAAIFQSLFSFRTGLFLHSPLFLVSFLAGIYYFFKEKFLITWWFVYFFLNTWIIASWWCWDYESPYGSRAYMEHTFFLLIPFLYFLRDFKKIALPFFIFFTLIGILRFLSFITDSMTDQRFTKDNYIESLFFWKEENKGRWSWSKACLPYGKFIADSTVLNISEVQTIAAEDEFINPIEFEYPKNRGKKRYYAYATLDKKLINERDWDGVYFVVDVFKDDQTMRYYKAMPLFADKFEAKNNWETFVYEESLEIDFLKKYDKMKIYIWNQGKKKFQLKNIKYWIKVVE